MSCSSSATPYSTCIKTLLDALYGPRMLLLINILKLKSKIYIILMLSIPKLDGREIAKTHLHNQTISPINPLSWMLIMNKTKSSSRISTLVQVCKMINVQIRNVDWRMRNVTFLVWEWLCTKSWWTSCPSISSRSCTKFQKWKWKNTTRCGKNYGQSKQSTSSVREDRL